MLLHIAQKGALPLGLGRRPKVAYRPRPRVLPTAVSSPSFRVAEPLFAVVRDCPRKGVLAWHVDFVGGEGWSALTDTLVGVSSLEKKAAKKTTWPDEAQRAAVRELVKAARARGEDLTGPEGLLKTITATVLESALEEGMTEHLGYDKHHPPAGARERKVRNGTRSKTVLSPSDGVRREHHNII